MAAPAPVAGVDAGRDLVEVAPGVHVATAVRYTTTSTVLVAADGTCVVVDPALTAAEVAGLAHEVRRRGWTPAGGFATHPHWDHVLWHEGLGDVPRWATGVCAATAERERESLVRSAADDGAGHHPATVARLTPLDAAMGASGGPVAHGTTTRGDTLLPWAARDVVVVAYDAHAPGSAALVVPDAGVLVAGDVLSDVEIPLLDDDADDPLADYRATLDAFEAAVERYAVQVLVPGHGHVTDDAGLRERVAADRAYLDALAAGRTPEDPRLADPWLRGEHARQLASLAAR
jgi:glyoxylase-like metal-dependent hydrolase (beta-lactamase superfamily II)